ncbi:MAG: hypothetical protein A2900_05195 [Candidatus Chisholmbacteria bacterium RIFCSPLOWO2_01_FULL_50_28]|uniref:Uncharacterized protein n=1 Tax=Candidatus Chisholmbacteria bacterium RIFCSPHIGHO2_01_FULL_52_32 TaxID=1797591 RepID=A0A1G1VS08_9BACT|nr:MAG: hypothetical protein A2786_01550 [Candidatus Chisholmbacteria bacterium RIFCSPHIGHO2_01_FULL_52_32]OGY20444.1 MAG: hypothetical protein A2900_05195 [Candidatus Chisholmbacteria bacterium RIFCSPLOWO2_01_FULL_50_28]
MQQLYPILAVLAAPLLLWPSLILIVALVKQAKTGTTLKLKHILIFLAVQIFWILLVFGLASSLILRPLNIRP